MKKILTGLLLIAMLLMAAALPAHAETAENEPVLLSEYWTAGSEAATSLNAYVLAVTDEASPDYIPSDDRIAVFDLDGTLMCETYPFCFEYMLFADYALNSGSDTVTDEVRAVAQEIMDAAGGKKPDGMSTRQAAAGAIAYRGMTMGELAEIVKKFKGSEAWGFTGMTRGEAYYRPMVELVDVLQQNGFTVYIVTATERNIVREVIAGTLNIPASQVIGTEYGYTATGQGDAADADYTFQPSDRIVFDGNYYGENAKMSKVDAIIREIGQQPVLAFGNSSGDLAMEIYTISGNPRKSAAYMVLADDGEREYGDAVNAEERKKAYEEQGIGIISMRDDFKTIYGEGVTKADLTDKFFTYPPHTGADVAAIFAASAVQPYTGKSGNQEMADTIWIYYTDGTFEQFAEADGEVLLFSTGTYELTGGTGFADDPSGTGKGQITIRREKKYSAEQGLADHRSEGTYKLGTLGFAQLYTPDAKRKAAAVFYGDDKQAWTGEDGQPKTLDTWWVYFSDGSFEQYAVLDNKVVLFSLGSYELSGNSSFVYEKNGEEPGVITIRRTMKYTKDGLAPYESSHEYELAKLGFIRIAAINP